jgi:hypothetical protein
MDTKERVAMANSGPIPLKRLIMCSNQLKDLGCAPILDLIHDDVGLRGNEL